MARQLSVLEGKVTNFNDSFWHNDKMTVLNVKVNIQSDRKQRDENGNETKYYETYVQVWKVFGTRKVQDTLARIKKGMWVKAVGRDMMSYGTEYIDKNTGEKKMGRDEIQKVCEIIYEDIDKEELIAKNKNGGNNNGYNNNNGGGFNNGNNRANNNNFGGGFDNSSNGFGGGGFGDLPDLPDFTAFNEGAIK